jgi:hypothetical protein
MEGLMGIFLPLYVLLGLGLIAASVLSRTTKSPFDAETSPSWRFGFFVLWTLSLPLVWLWEWWGVEICGFGGLGWKSPTEFPSVPALVYGRKVVSDLWAAVAVVLAALAWNKP